jgi:hypothetical protein
LLLIAVACHRAFAPSPVGAADPLAAVPLAGGKRWHADDHVRDIPAKVQAAVQDGCERRLARTKALATQLQDLTDELLGGCSTDGAGARRTARPSG